MVRGFSEKLKSSALLIGACVVSLLMAMPLSAADEKDISPTPVDFGRQIRPILAKRCFACHGPDVAESGLRLNDPESVFAELDSGELGIVPGKPEDSELLRRIATDDEIERMPPEEKPLPAEEIALIRRWISEGAAWDKHWAFQPIQHPQPPAVKNSEWVRNPIDAFILARLEKNGLNPAPPADKLALLRRAYYDLTGLPPTPDEVTAFLADTAPDAYETVVDRLLASPRYGERWARHWLDLVRYAETNSYERDGDKPNAWRYRDYVIRSLNDDKPYDRFLTEQLAGDELPDASAETIIATGYYRLGLWDDEPVDREQAYYDELDDILTTTSQVMLGLTVNCARCHDHKIDPIPQTDYYSLLSFFEGVPSYGIRSDQLSYNQTDISSPELATQHAELDRQKKAVREKMQPIEQAGIVKMSAPDQRQSEGRGRQKLLDEKLKDYLDESAWAEYSSLKTELDKLNAIKLPPRESALSVARCNPRPPQSHVLMRGNVHAKGEEVAPGFPTILNAPVPEIPVAPEGAKTSGRRTVLAEWITSPDNIMTSRVIANRIWQHHFGRGIVRSTNNFGLLGDAPTHPLLLDWLATELVAGDWRLKPLHKTIMMSAAYQMSSQGNPQGLSRDPRNDLFWRFDMRRLSAEELRDSIHAVNGRLNLQMYGHGVYPEISAEVLAGQSQPGLGWGKSTPEEQSRRSIYIHVKRSLITPMLASFDFPETDSSCEARFATTQPTQALGMINGDFIHKQAIEFAKRLRNECGDDTQAQIRRALELALAHPADPQEIARGAALIEKLQKQHKLTADQALEYFCLYIYNLNEFTYLD
ncbi:PSD1 and planctomycete cytochrome C domain-containing protein [Symmachiella dynata]|uniref:PSD1 and planctomycete cytochrome C domain-containing protein n=1 Tax=Symmachiella dynata TaxID=2527995 RepID=UPI0030EB3690